MKSYEYIRSQDLSIVVTGQINSAAIANLKQLKAVFPLSQIIISVSENNNTKEIAAICDKIVITKYQKNYFFDKSCLLYEHRPFTYNKQQTEINAGLKAVTTKFALKIRFDFKVLDDSIISTYNSLLNHLLDFVPSKKLFEQKVLICNYLTGYHNSLPFYISDLIALGKTKDLLLLFNGSQYTEEEIDYFTTQESQQYNNPLGFTHRYTNEQMLFFKLLKTCGYSFDIPPAYENSSEAQRSEFDKILISNFIILTFDLIHIQTKFPFDARTINWDIFTDIYSDYCAVSDDTKNFFRSIKLQEDIINTKIKLNKHIKILKNYTQLIKQIAKHLFFIIKEPLSIIFYYIKLLSVRSKATK